MARRRLVIYHISMLMYHLLHPASRNILFQLPMSPPCEGVISRPIPNNSTGGWKTQGVLNDDKEKDFENISWAAYHASHQTPGDRIITPTALLPLFQECAHTVAMIKHSMDVVKNAVEHLNTGQTPVLTPPAAKCSRQTDPVKVA